MVNNLAVFAVRDAVQTPLVESDSGIGSWGDVLVSTLIQAVSLAVGLGIALLLVRRREWRAATA